MNIVYIHGANATPTSFNFIRSQIGGVAFDLAYQSANGFARNLDAMTAELRDMEDVFFVAHSLGGIYALHLASRLSGRMRGAVTLATPYAGSDSARIAQILLPAYNAQLMRDIDPHGGPIRNGHAIKIRCPWTQVVTMTGSSSLMMSANDGVVTQASMRRRAADMRIVEVDANHYEVMLDMVALGVIRDAITGVAVAA